MRLPEFGLSDKALRTVEQPISFLMAAAVSNPNLISLAAGLIDYASLPLKEAKCLAGDILGNTKTGQTALQYGTTHGLAEMRELLLEHLCRLEGCRPSDLSLKPDNCIITEGSQQALYMVTDVLVNPGDIVITAAPTYFVYTGTLVSFGAQVYSVPMDEQGMRTDKLEELLQDLDHRGLLDRVKLIYEVTYYQNPTGLSLSADRRRHLVELARRYSRKNRILVLEDAAYRELRYDGPTWQSAKVSDPDNEFAALCLTFSKPFSAGLKTGYVFLPDDLVDPVLQTKGNQDFGSCNFAQHLIYRAMCDGVYDTHVERLREVYRAKRDTMLDALDEYLGDLKPEVRWTRPNGGLYVWLTLPDWVNAGRDHALFRLCMEKGVLYVPGEYCYAPLPGERAPGHEIRLSYGVQDASSIREGVRRLAEALHQILEQKPAGGSAAARS